MSSVTVAKASVILAFKFVIPGTGVEDTLSLTYPHKKKSRGWYPAIMVARVSDHLSQSTCLEMLYPKTVEHVNPSVEVHHLVGKLSTVETLLTEVQCEAPTCFLVINVCNQGRLYAYPVLPNRVYHLPHFLLQNNKYWRVWKPKLMSVALKLQRKSELRC